MFLVHNGQARWTSTTLHVRSIFSISMYCYVVKCEPYLLHAKGILYMTKQTFQNLKQKHKADLKGRKKNVRLTVVMILLVLTSPYASLTT